MKIMSRIAGLALLLCLTQAGAQEPEKAPPPTREETAQSEKVQREQMRREVEEASREIGAYTSARRDDALARARKAMQAMEDRMERRWVDWSREAQRQNAEARAIRERQDAQLREQREHMRARYRAMEESNAAAWARAKENFVKAYRELGEALGVPPKDNPSPKDDTEQSDGRDKDDREQGEE